ncbi:TIGR04222 domain-containing membrane protein [Candidatus Albibeggiatoa sp. nov. NOAA]|uniref:TIGR04222 domain-containing membrane protein n=1 Tax=Candidatus Albibeggiatoa sp. nov. NOAA TaxID=3162724 RepID=UPI003303981F|nr:TIGR04222 domain-containing membrane protein [Thiotrichaceae bacterium]
MNISVTEFLILYPIVSIAIAFIGFWLQRYDSTRQYSTPQLFTLSAIETAALSAEHRGVIQTALFKLWLEGAITIKGKANQAYATCNHKNRIRLDNDIEKALYYYIFNQPEHSFKINKLFKPRASFRTQLNAALEPIYTKLERQRFRCNDALIFKHKLIHFLVPLSILIIGSLQLNFMPPLGYQILLVSLMLILMPLIAWVILPNVIRQTHLGRRYLAQYRNKLNQFNVLKDGHDGVWRVAVFGFAGVANWEVFDPFNNAFVAPDTETSSRSKNSSQSQGGGGSGGCSGDGDSSSNGGGCGGGCG